MITSNSYTPNPNKGQLYSYIPGILRSKGWDTNTFVGHMLIAGVSQDTAYRLAHGETNFNAKTLKVAADVLGCSSISELVDIAK